MENTPSAEELLTIADQSRRAAVDRSRSPWWYYPAAGAVLGLTSVVVMIAPGIPTGVAIVGMGLALTFLGAVRRRLTGTRVSEFRRRRAVIYAGAAVLLNLAVLGVGLLLVFDRHINWVAWVAGATIFVVTVACGWLFERASRTAVRF